MGKKEKELMDKELMKEDSGKLTPTQEQMITSKFKYESKKEIREKFEELEKLKHKNIIEEIKELNKTKITSFNRG